MSPSSLTNHLLQLPTRSSYEAATRHPFLASAANRTLSPQLLSYWLSQDRIYAAHAYPRFIGLLISKIPFSALHPVDSPEEEQNKKWLKLLSFALQNIVAEVNFFKDVAEKWGLQVEGWKERKGTRDYVAEMARISSLGTLEEEFVFLWAMERVYLDAWTYVHENSPANSAEDQDTTSRAIASFSENWSSKEFVQFIDELAEVVNELGIKQGTEAWAKAEEVWQRVVELEVEFWPHEGEELTGARK
ncbi:hypothetical protein BOTBODRAFT_129414 [Botryobasidium botryosum FD-172 SS1]|uniref:Thiaminase-2/PQQC domain-containing protein n=1 Tax=Botryobasidium botryosum (strain FD-172 SS1) TaxID=930990 RepID=A0A067MQV0_BOTB1|nr:hypothetical protein BOTBODRAFT_129414 [Botryobasidium botryosum FD-172 SS1]